MPTTAFGPGPFFGRRHRRRTLKGRLKKVTCSPTLKKGWKKGPGPNREKGRADEAEVIADDQAGGGPEAVWSANKAGAVFVSLCAVGVAAIAAAAHPFFARGVRIIPADRDACVHRWAVSSVLWAPGPLLQTPPSVDWRSSALVSIAHCVRCFRSSRHPIAIDALSRRPLRRCVLLLLCGPDCRQLSPPLRRGG